MSHKVDYQNSDIGNPHDVCIVRMCIAILDRSLRDLESVDALERRHAFEWFEDTVQKDRSDGGFTYKDVQEIICMGVYEIQIVKDLIIVFKNTPRMLGENGRPITIQAFLDSYRRRTHSVSSPIPANKTS